MKLRHNLLYCTLVALTLFGTLPFLPAAKAYTQADLNRINSQISALNSQINEYEQRASELSAQADTLGNQIALLQNEQASLKIQIDLKQAEHDQIVAEIDTIQRRINDNSDTIGYVIAQYYYNDDVSTIERLASSESFASFVDDESRLSTISDTLADIIQENNNLKKQLIEKKQDAERVLADLSSQKAQLVAKENEQALLLAETRSNEAIYRQKKQETNKQKEELERQQQEAIAELNRIHNASNIAAGDPNKGGYPYSGQCPAAKLNNAQYGDRWGMYICECVSYTAWRVHHAYGNMPYWGGKGHARQWIANAKAANIVVSNTPKVGSVGISMAGTYGHAVWVEAVSGGRVYISQYNARNAATNYRRGEYSEQWIDASAYQYIYFGG